MSESSPGMVKALYSELENSIMKVFVGTGDSIRPVILGFLSGMHVLLEDIPGVGKTTLALALARSSGLDFGRIQFTPDLLPGDIIGMTVWDPDSRDFRFKAGAVNHQFILADEINRASERTQSALLEAMAEGQLSVEGEKHPLPQPFFVIATQNPITFAGTFMLPESQTDRFGVSTALGYPGEDHEKTILRRFRASNPLESLSPVCTPREILQAREEISRVELAENVEEYLIGICSRTRKDGRYRLGVSPRGSIHLMRAAQAEAAAHGRDFVIPEDVSRAAGYVLPHRVRLSSDPRNSQIDEHHMISQSLREQKVPHVPVGRHS